MIINILIYILVAILFISGLVLTVLMLPGIWLIYIGVLLLGFVDTFSNITPQILFILFFISLLSTFLDNIVVALGAKKMGGSIWGMLGAILGGIIGLIIGNIVGMFLGPLVGATIFEYIFARKNYKNSLKAGVGSVIGVFLSIILRFGINVGVIVYSLIIFL